jgi:hypothetical protein
MRCLPVLFLVALTASCATQPDVTTYDFSKRAGLYVLGYTASEEVRQRVEQQLVADVEARGMTAWPSHVDLPVLRQTSRSTVLNAANAKQALAVLVVNQVVPGEGGLIENPLRISPEHPDLAAFYEYTKSVEREFDPNKEVFAEVNAFLIEGDRGRLVWSGTTWSFDADGKGGAIGGMSTNIADELEDIRRALLAE